MPRHDCRHCRNCGRDKDECGVLSWSRLCSDCGKYLLEENIDGIHDHSGVAWARWKVGMAMSVLRDRPELVNALASAGAFQYDDLQPKE